MGGRVSTYLNFAGRTAEAFEAYRAAFGTDYLVPPLRMREMPRDAGAPPLPEARRLYGALAVDCVEAFPIQAMPWGQHWGTCLDRFSVRWMFSAPLEPSVMPDGDDGHSAQTPRT